MNDLETWKDVVGYEGFYQVSNKGRIRSVDRLVHSIKGERKTRLVRGEVKKPTIRPNGYLKVSLYKYGRSVTLEVQRVVASAFIPNPHNKEQVNHIDGVKTNNRVENLEWVTPRENTLHSVNVLHNGLKPVSQYDLNGNYIRSFCSAAEAERTTGVRRCSISNVICGRRNKAGGYIWKYAEGSEG